MTDHRNTLLLATLSRAGQPLDSDELLAQATELALDHQWTPDHLAGLNRKGVAKRCRDMVEAGLLVVSGVGVDGAARRTTPKYAMTKNLKVPDVPPPPPLREEAPKESPYDAMDRTQLMAVLEAHDEFAECVGRFFRDLTNVRERVRRRLQSAGLDTRGT
jgi:hypothetical protein